MATITNSIFLNDEDGDLKVHLEYTTDLGLRRLTIEDGYTGTGINILGTYAALEKIARTLVDGLARDNRQEDYIHYMEV